MEIYSLSLSSPFVDDAFLNRAVSSIPKHSIFLLEDIDCAFPSRNEVEEQIAAMSGYPINVNGSNRRSAVTMSGLLNVIDGVGSEEGKLFFATVSHAAALSPFSPSSPLSPFYFLSYTNTLSTLFQTNYPDRLDPALMRPGRIDKKIEYRLATVEQATALYTRFFPSSRFINSSSNPEKDLTDVDVDALAKKFGAGVPEDEFSTAELQGFLLSHKKDPIFAAENITSWVEHERTERREREEREEQRKIKMKEAREKYGVGGGYGFPPFAPVIPPPAERKDESEEKEKDIQQSDSDVTAEQKEETPLKTKANGVSVSPPATP